MSRPFSRAQLKSQAWEPIHRPRNFTKAEVSRLEWPPGSGESVILKDISRRPLWFRLLLGRFLMSREWRALKALESLDVAPRPVARVDADAIVMGFVPGKPLYKHAKPGEATPLLREAERVLREIHARGVTHGDLHRANLLFDEAGRARVVDWATGSVFSPTRGVATSSQRRWQRLDERALAKLKFHHAPDLLTQAEKTLLARQSLPERLVRALGKKLRGKWSAKKSR